MSQYQNIYLQCYLAFCNNINLIYFCKHLFIIQIVVAKLNQQTVLDHEKRHFKAAKVEKHINNTGLINTGSKFTCQLVEKTIYVKLN